MLHNLESTNLKSGMPLGVLIPAPATTTTFLTDSLCSNSAASLTVRTLPFPPARADNSLLEKRNCNHYAFVTHHVLT